MVLPGGLGCEDVKARGTLAVDAVGWQVAARGAAGIGPVTALAGERGGGGEEGGLGMPYSL